MASRHVYQNWFDSSVTGTLYVFISVEDTVEFDFVDAKFEYMRAGELQNVYLGGWLVWSSLICECQSLFHQNIPSERWNSLSSYDRLFTCGTHGASNRRDRGGCSINPPNSQRPKAEKPGIAMSCRMANGSNGRGEPLHLRDFLNGCCYDWWLFSQSHIVMNLFPQISPSTNLERCPKVEVFPKSSSISLGFSMYKLSILGYHHLRRPPSWRGFFLDFFPHLRGCTAWWTSWTTRLRWLMWAAMAARFGRSWKGLGNGLDGGRWVEDVEIQRSCWRIISIDRWRWMEMDGDGWRWMEMDGDGWRWMDG